MMSPRHGGCPLPDLRRLALLPCLVLALSVVVGPMTSPDLKAQEQEEVEPLRKSEVVDLLTSGSYTPDEASRRIRSRCLAFRPTERDFADFRELGAGEGVMEAIRECLEAEAEDQAGEEAPPPPPLRFSELDSLVSVTAGDTATFSVRVFRGEQPARNVRVVLRDRSDRVLQYPGAVLEAFSDSTGAVEFRIPVPGRVGEVPVLVDAGQDSALVRFRVRPAAPSRATVEPEALEWEGAEDDLRVSLRVMDRFGNSLDSLSVSLTTPGRDVLAGAVTGPDGSVTLRVTGADLAGIDSLGVVAGGRDLASLPVVRQRADPAGEAKEAGAEPPTPEPTDRERELEALTSRAERLLSAGEPDEAARLLRRATEVAADSVALWTRLAAAQRQSGDDEAAGESLRKALELAPDRREDLRSRLRAVIADQEAVRGRLVAWGGDSFGDPPSMVGSGFHRGLLEIWPLPGSVGLFAEYDRGIEPDRTELIRGSAAFESVYGGVLLGWGEGRRFSTRLEGGTRKRPPADSEQRIYRLEQVIRLGDGLKADFQRSALRLAAGLGDWQDAEFDEYFLRAGVDVPLLSTLRISSDVMFTDAIGTWPSTDRQRHRVREFRLQVAPTYRRGNGLEATLGMGVGRVAPPGGQGSDRTLLDTFVRGYVPIVRNVRLELFYRHQAPALNRELDFHVLSAGLTAEIPY